jgi:hypothetical protein
MGPGEIGMARWFRYHTIHEFLIATGAEILKRKKVIPNSVVRKWSGVLFQDFRFCWNSVWVKERVSKEADLLWLIWHRAVAVNHWRGRVDGTVDIRCPVCPRRSEESVLHRFWECSSARWAWQWAIHIMNTLISGRDARGPWQMLTWKHGIFSDGIPRKFNQVKRIWMELRTTVLWTLWIERNDKVFNDCSWTNEKRTGKIWSGMLDYGRMEWSRVKAMKASHPTKAIAETAQFMARRGRNNVFAVITNEVPQWQPKGPVTGFVFEPP